MLVNNDPELNIIKSAFFISSKTLGYTVIGLLYLNVFMLRFAFVICSSPTISSPSFVVPIKSTLSSVKGRSFPLTSNMSHNIGNA